MADVTVVVADIKVQSSTSIVRVVQFGEAATQGETCYLKASDSKYYRADSDTEAEAEVKGILLTKIDADLDYGVILTSGDIDLGATLLVGQTYVQSTNVGKIAVESDLTTGDYVTILGVATAADKLKVNINITGIAHA